MATSYWLMFSLLSVMFLYASSTSNHIASVGSKQLKFWADNVVNDMPQALFSKLSPMNKSDSDYYTSLVSKETFFFDTQSCLVAGIFCVSETYDLSAARAGAKIYKIYPQAKLYGTKIPDQAKVYASKVPDQAKVYASKIPDQAKVYASKIPNQAKVYASKIPEQAKVYASRIPDQAKVYASKIPDRAKIYAYKIPDQVKVYASKIPDQAKVYASKIPNQAKVYASKISDRATPYLYPSEIPDQVKVHPFEIPGQVKVHPFKIPDQAKVYASKLPDQAKVYATKIPNQAKVYATSHSNHDHLGEVSFFRLSILKPEKTIHLDNLENPFPHRSFFPSQIASKISINSNELQHLFPKTFSSTVTKDTIGTTILSCNSPTLKGEVKTCAKSLEEMIDFSRTVLAKNHLTALTTKSVEGSGENLRIKKLHKIDAQKSVSCHEIFLPFATYFCHLLSSTRIYAVELVDPNTNAPVNTAMVVCHMDTSSWPVDHPAFHMLKLSPGKGEACHWMSQADLVWIGA